MNYRDPDQADEGPDQGLDRAETAAAGDPREAVVAAEIGEREAHFRISLPPSATLGARIGRCFRTIFSAGSALRSLELQQLDRSGAGLRAEVAGL